MRGPGFIWIHLEGGDEEELALPRSARTFPTSPPTR